jgi:hypothetical protein
MESRVSEPLDKFDRAMLRYLDFDCDRLYLEKIGLDQWWRVALKCNHGEFQAVSRGPLDLWRALDAALDEAQTEHESLRAEQGQLV